MGFLEQINKELLLSESFSFAFSSISKFAVKIIPKYTSAFNTTELEIFHILYLVCLNFGTKSSNRKTHVNNKNLVNQLKLENERLVKFSPFKFKTFNIQIPKKLPENLKIILRALINKPFYSVLEDVEALIKDPSEYKYFYEIFSSVGQHIHNSDLIDFFDISIAELTILERPVSKISKNKLVKTNIKIKFIYQIKQPSVKLRAKYIRMSPHKVRRVIDQIRGRSYRDALMILEFLPYNATAPIWQVLTSAAANAKNNYNLNKQKLIINEIYADEGPKLKRSRPRAQGRAFPILKPTCHITIVVKEIN